MLVLEIEVAEGASVIRDERRLLFRDRGGADGGGSAVCRDAIVALLDLPPQELLALLELLDLPLALVLLVLELLVVAIGGAGRRVRAGRLRRSAGKVTHPRAGELFVKVLGLGAVALVHAVRCADWRGHLDERHKTRRERRAAV